MASGSLLVILKTHKFYVRGAEMTTGQVIALILNGAMTAINLIWMISIKRQEERWNDTHQR